MSASAYQRMFFRYAEQFVNVRQIAMWTLPVTIGAGWLLFPALDYQWRISIGITPDPERFSKAVNDAKEARRLAAKGSAGPAKVKAAVVEEEEEEEEEEVEEEESASDDAAGDVEATGEGEEEEEGDEEEEEEEEEKSVKMPLLYEPVVGKNLSLEDRYDNMNLKAMMKLGSDDDDDDEEEEDDADEE